jgi:hypothetical protein
MPVTDISGELRKRRNKKKNRRLFKKLVSAAAAAAVVLLAVAAKPLWYPRLEGILSKKPAADGLPDGNFPLPVQGVADYGLAPLDDGFCVLGDSRFSSYTLDGVVNFTAQHTFAAPALEVSGKRVLIYDSGGKSFSLMSRSREIYNIKTEAPILFARLSDGDFAAVVTRSDKFLAQLTVYDGGGKNIFGYGSVDRIIDVCFDAENGGCYITVLASKGGLIVCEILYYRFGSVEYDLRGNPAPVWKSGAIDSLVTSVKNFAGGLMAFGDTRCLYYDGNGVLVDNYEYGLPLRRYSSSGSVAGLIFDDFERGASVLVIIDGGSGTMNEIPLERQAEGVSVSDGLVFVHAGREILVRDAAGELSGSIAADTEFVGFLRIADYIYILGYDEINRVPMALNISQ